MTFRVGVTCSKKRNNPSLPWQWLASISFLCCIVFPACKLSALGRLYVEDLDPWGCVHSFVSVGFLIL